MGCALSYRQTAVGEGEEAYRQAYIENGNRHATAEGRGERRPW